MKKFIIIIVLALVLLLIILGPSSAVREKVLGFLYMKTPKTSTQPVTPTVPKQPTTPTTPATTTIKTQATSTPTTGTRATGTPIVGTTNAVDIRISSPSTGDNWKIGTSQTIRFNISGPIEKNYRIKLSLTGDSSGHIAVVDPNATNSYTWNVPAALFNGDVGGNQLAGNHKIVAGLFDGDICITGGNCNPNIKWGKLIKSSESPNFVISP